jgi:hypothetical protein
MLDCRCRSLPGPKSDSKVKTDESKGVPAFYGLGPRWTWNTAWESLCKFVSSKLLRRINAINKIPTRPRGEFIWQPCPHYHHKAPFCPPHPRSAIQITSRWCENDMFINRTDRQWMKRRHKSKNPDIFFINLSRLSWAKARIAAYMFDTYAAERERERERERES